MASCRSPIVFNSGLNDKSKTRMGVHAGQPVIESCKNREFYEETCGICKKQILCLQILPEQYPV
jgi:hypothetical protein